MENVMSHVNHRLIDSLTSEVRSSSVDIEEIVLPTPDVEPEPKQLQDKTDDGKDEEWMNYKIERDIINLCDFHYQENLLRSYRPEDKRKIKLAHEIFFECQGSVINWIE